ncbi:MAG: hypothetical protein E7391_04675 [Ruminococcaceae bacterium]|nr:hypothetical protein [Oscillospiraceae bacterium]
MESYKNTIDFSLWEDDEVLLKVSDGGGFGGDVTIIDDEKFKKCLLMDGIKHPYERIKFVTAIEGATSGNKYLIKVWLKLPSYAKVEKADALIGNMGLFDIKHENKKCFEISKEWTECEFDFTLKDRLNYTISVEQSEESAKFTDEILIGKMEVCLIEGTVSKEKEIKDLSFKESTKNTLHLIGDSIVTKYGYDTITRGWGMFIGENFDDEKLIVNNVAVGGWSTKTYLKTIAGQKRWNYVKDNLKEGDFVIISLGINDMSNSKETVRVTVDEYKQNLQRMFDELNEDGVTIIFATPTITLNDGKIENFRRCMADAMIEVYENNKDKENLYLIDLNKLMFERLKELEEKIGYDKILETYYSVGVDGLPDTTHQREAGSRYIISLILELLDKTDCKINNYIK